MLDKIKIKVQNLFQNKFGNMSDGYHTFDELYENRCLLFIALMVSHPRSSWYSEYHDDGTNYDGWFIAGMNLPKSGTITYHLSNKYLDMLSPYKTIKKLDKAPPWDGHTNEDVLERLKVFIENKVPGSKKKVS